MQVSLIEKSLELALAAHRGQSDKAGRPYILHPLRLMTRMVSDEAKAVALLHDVIEDCGYTSQQLIDEGIPANVVKAVECLTRREGEDYRDFVTRAAENDLAKKVKIADIEDNINVLRLDELVQKDLERVKKYHEAWSYLTNPQEHD